MCIHCLAFEVSESDLHNIKEEFNLSPEDFVEIEQKEFKSIIIDDPNGYCLEFYADK
jgi:hypothetical protein